MRDLEIAKNELHKKQLTLSIVKNGQVLFTTGSHRISGFLGAIEKLSDQLQGASVADRVAGKALALLCVYTGVKEVYAEVLSRKAKAMFEEYNVAHEWKQLVDNVLDPNRTDVCPFEKLAADITDPKESYGAFKTLLDKMRSCQ